ncbi:MAG: hypothetical protein HND54_04890 [Bacteroidetes bacterium]|nr:hypothetical protein [Bacteroidota bacterium]MCB0802580.1 hypothetical protein [Flavobacteriales bacterium]NOG57053.1 hypothetical protein [Bacteroidota bacterium]
MKNIIGLLVFIAACLTTNIASAKAYESTQTNINNQQLKEKVDSKVKKKPTKYDFSLFKFIPPTQKIEKDTIDRKQLLPEEDVKNETVYEKPLAFFKFSYAS